ncbi:hypothetical protein D3C73_1567330 [compost metagenome]
MSDPRIVRQQVIVGNIVLRAILLQQLVPLIFEVGGGFVVIEVHVRSAPFLKYENRIHLKFAPNHTFKSAIGG